MRGSEFLRGEIPISFHGWKNGINKGVKAVLGGEGERNKWENKKEKVKKKRGKGRKERRKKEVKIK